MVISRTKRGTFLSAFLSMLLLLLSTLSQAFVARTITTVLPRQRQQRPALLLQLQQESEQEFEESEQAAAWDAHDCSDPGMEAAAEERALAMAQELLKKKTKDKNKASSASSSSNYDDQHLAHGASQVHEEDSSELLESEDAAAWDAHDCSDAGMEAAAEERAVMMAREYVHQQIVTKKQSQAQADNSQEK